MVLLLLGAYLMNDLLFDDAPTREAVPNLVGMTEEEAGLAIVDRGFDVGRVTREPSDTVPADTVMEQDPDRDTFQEPGTSIDFVLSLGKPEVEVPFVVGRPRKEARELMVAADLKVRFEEAESDEEKFQVLGTTPAAGTSVAEGTTIVLTYSDGPEKVPDVRGLKQGAGRADDPRGRLRARRTHRRDLRRAQGDGRRPDPGRWHGGPGDDDRDLRVRLRGARGAHGDADRDADRDPHRDAHDSCGPDRDADHHATCAGHSGIGVAQVRSSRPS